MKIPNSIFTIFFVSFSLALCFGQLQRLQLTLQVAVYVHELMLIGWALTFHQAILGQMKKFSLTHSKLCKWLGALHLYWTAQNVFFLITAQDVQPFFYQGRVLLYAQLVPLLSFAMSRKILTRQLLRFSLIAIGLSFAVTGFLQYVFLPDTRFLLASGWDEHYYRLISPLFDPNFTAAILVMSILVAIYTVKTRQQYLLIPVFLLTILLTYSRAGYIAFVAGIGSLAALRPPRSHLLLIPVLLLAIPFLPRPAGEGVKLERTASILTRTQSINAALTFDSPLELVFGEGLYRQTTTTQLHGVVLPNHATAPDNSFIFIFTGLGIVGSGGVLFLLWQLHKSYQFSPLFYSAVIAASTHAMFNNTLFYPWVMVFLLTLVMTEGKKRLTA